ncbi:unnamed protein product [Heterobilharzia americana]|nr:unnamed protein product [Heterobilharzia americana]
MEKTITEAKRIGAFYNFYTPVEKRNSLTNSLRWFFVLDFESTCFGDDSKQPAEINWDISTCLWDECRRKKLPLPGDMLSRIDLKAIFQQWLGSHKVGQKWRGGLKDALHLIGLRFEGRPHRGIDDAKNTARLLLHLLSKNILNLTAS